MIYDCIVIPYSLLLFIPLLTVLLTQQLRECLLVCLQQQQQSLHLVQATNQTMRWGYEILYSRGVFGHPRSPNIYMGLIFGTAASLGLNFALFQYLTLFNSFLFDMSCYTAAKMFVFVVVILSKLLWYLEIHKKCNTCTFIRDNNIKCIIFVNYISWDSPLYESPNGDGVKFDTQKS